ncbi:hypothetical protein Dfri01_05220 [Dyadobacter frigoris]|nr:hypothetical protein Dfri01_05220 [Dyadobacter frigoris]
MLDFWIMMFVVQAYSKFFYTFGSTFTYNCKLKTELLIVHRPYRIYEMAMGSRQVKLFSI